MRLTEQQLRRITRETILRKQGKLHEESKIKKGLKGLFGWMKEPDWEKELERIETAENIKTIGDLKFVLDMAKLSKTNEKAAAAWSNFGSGFLADLVGGGTIKSLADVVKDTYEAPDEATGGTALDYLNVDDGIAKIVDDPIENAYIAELEDMIEAEDESTPLVDFDVTKGLASFIKKNIDDRTVTGWEGQQEGRSMRISKRQLKKIIREEKQEGRGMRITKRQLKRIIKEEKQRLLREQGVRPEIFGWAQSKGEAVYDQARTIFGDDVGVDIIDDEIIVEVGSDYRVSQTEDQWRKFWPDGEWDNDGNLYTGIML